MPYTWHAWLFKFTGTSRASDSVWRSLIDPAATIPLLQVHQQKLTTGKFSLLFLFHWWLFLDTNNASTLATWLWTTPWPLTVVGIAKVIFFFGDKCSVPPPTNANLLALRVLIGHRNFRLCQGLCRVIADPTISTMYPTIKTQSHSSYFNNTFPFSISLFPFWIPLSIYYPTIKISIPLFQVIPLPLFLYIPKSAVEYFLNRKNHISPNESVRDTEPCWIRPIRHLVEAIRTFVEYSRYILVIDLVILNIVDNSRTL